MQDFKDSLPRQEPQYEPATPSRSRTTPSGAVEWCLEQLKKHPYYMREAIDLGCGKGRNSIFLARKGFHVTSMDFSPGAIESLNKTAARLGLSDKIRSAVYDVTTDWPVAPHTTDLIIDAFCFRHIASQTDCQIYKSNLLRALTVYGHYLISLKSIGDGYYGQYRRRHNQARMPVDSAVCIDPVNGVESSLYSREKIVAFFRPELQICAEFKDLSPYSRGKDDGTYALLFHRNPKSFYT